MVGKELKTLKLAKFMDLIKHLCMYDKCERTCARCISSTPICVPIFDPSNINNIRRPSSTTLHHHAPKSYEHVHESKTHNRSPSD
jgi:hypothetical protein